MANFVVCSKCHRYVNAGGECTYCGTQNLSTQVAREFRIIELLEKQNELLTNINTSLEGIWRRV